MRAARSAFRRGAAPFRKFEAENQVFGRQFLRQNNKGRVHNCLIGAYEAYSSRSVHSHLNLERLEWWAPEGRKRLLHTPHPSHPTRPPRTQGTSPWARRRPPECAGILKAYFFAASAPGIATIRRQYLPTISFHVPSQLEFSTQLIEIYRLGQGRFGTSGRPRVTYLVQNTLSRNDRVAGHLALRQPDERMRGAIPRLGAPGRFRRRATVASLFAVSAHAVHARAPCH